MGVGSGGVGALLKVQSLFSEASDAALVVVFCLLRLSRCFSRSAVCLLCPCVFYCFLLFCALLLLFCFVFLFFSFFNCRAAAIARLFVATVSVTRQSCFVGLGGGGFVSFFPSAGRRANALFTVGGVAAKHVQIWPLTCIFFILFFFFCFCVTARDAADCVIV